MKINQKLYMELRKEVSPYMATDAMNSQRARWDALWASGFDVSKLYCEGLNDNHIDTALKKIATFNE